MLVFVLAVGLLLVYFFHYDRVLDHKREDVGIGFMVLTAGLVFVVSNVPVALEYLPEDGSPPRPKASTWRRGSAPTSPFRSSCSATIRHPFD